MSAQSTPPLIAHIIYALGTGGLENGLVNIINRAATNRYRHTIICLTDADDFANRITAPNVKIIELHKKPGHDVGLYWRLIKVLRNLQPAIVHTRNLTSLEMQLLTVFLPGVKRIHGEHGRDMNDLEGSNWKYNLLRRAVQPLIHQYIPVSQDLAVWLQAVIRVPAHKVKQIYNGVDTEKFFPAGVKKIDLVPEKFLHKGSFVIGAIGRIAEVKNHRSLIIAVDQVLKQKPQLREKIRVILVGGGPLFSQLQSLVAQLNLSEIVWMPGDRTDIPSLLQLMDVFVQPSLAEGVSNTVLEAMATGLPIIATRAGGNIELVEEGVNGRLVEVDDHEQLAEVLQMLITDEALVRSMGEKSLDKVRDTFKWQQTVSKYLGVYDQVLGINHSV